MEVMCTQCGNPCTGYFQFSVCSPCYSENVRAEQKRVLERSAEPASDWPAQQYRNEQTHE